MSKPKRQFRIAGPRKPEGTFPLIGVITPVRNRRDWTVGFVERFARQDYPVFTHYIVDSASTDGTPEAISAMGLRSVKLIAAPDSAYWTAATNLGVRQALADGCDFILTINDDAIVADDFVSTLVTATQAHEAQLVGSMISYVNQPHIIWGVGAYNDFENGHFVQTGFGNMPEEEFNLGIPEQAELIEVDYLCGNGTLVHRSVFEAIGHYDEKNFPHYHADTEFTMRAEMAGIARWVAREARVYNRFTEEQDGPLSRKNRRLFSLRSANFVRPIIYVLRRYAPIEWRVRAFLGYLAGHLGASTPRNRSKMLRMAALLTGSEWAGIRNLKLIPGLSPLENFRFDLALLQHMPAFGLVDAAYAYLLLRLPSEAERKDCLNPLRHGLSPAQFLADIVGSPEFAMRQPDMAQLAPLLAAPVRITTAILRDARFSTEERRMLAQLVAERPAVETLKTRALAAKQLADEILRKNVMPLLDRHTWKPAMSREAAPFVPAPPRDESGLLTIYFNIDVFCMAQLDPKAATGVYRYASQVFRELASRKGIQLRTFYSSSLSVGYAQWQEANPVWAPQLMGVNETPPPRSVVFYPYFALQESDVRLSGLPVALTICDLFPLVNPEWFSDVAVQNFKRQLHVLPGIDHFFCISRATEIQLRSTIPGLRGTSSVAHLAATLPGALPKKEQSDRPARYFLCVGTIEPRKNLKSAIEAFARLDDEELSDLHMLVAGQDGWSLSREQLRAMAGNKADRVRFLGRMSDPDLHASYRDAEFTVFTSLAEGFGLPIVESFRHGTPVITSNNSSMVEIAGNAALLVDPRDVSAIAAAMRQMATEPKTRARYAAAAHARAEDFSWGACAEAHALALAALAKPH